MKIHHLETGKRFDLSDANGTFRVYDYQSGKSASFKEPFVAVWHVIENIRYGCFEQLNGDDIRQALSALHINLDHVPKALLNTMRREKIDRTYYDQVFLKLLSAWRAQAVEVELSNRTNFIVHHELVHIARKYAGERQPAPSFIL